MKKHFLFGLLAVLLAFGLVFTGCDSGSGGSSGGGDGRITETRSFEGTDDQGRVIVVTLIRTAGNGPFNPANGNEYTITLDGQQISSGTITVDNQDILFWPSGGGASFPGTIIGNFLSIPAIPYNGGTIRGFSLEAKAGTGGGPNFITYTIVQENGVNDTTTTDGITITFDATRDLERELNDFLASGIRLTQGSGFAVLDLDSLVQDTTNPEEWEIDVLSVAPAGLVFFSITHRNVDPTPQPLVVYHQDVDLIEIDDVKTDGTANVTTSTYIDFEFDTGEAPATFTQNDIVFSYPSTGAAAFTPRLSTSANPNPYVDPNNSDTWRLDIASVAEQGTVNIFINKAGYDPVTPGATINKARRTLELYETDGTTAYVPDLTTPVGVNFPTIGIHVIDGAGIDTGFSGSATVTISGATESPNGSFGTVYALAPDLALTGRSTELTILQYNMGNAIAVEFLEGVGYINLRLATATDGPNSTQAASDITFRVHGVEGLVSDTFAPISLIGRAGVASLKVTTDAVAGPINATSTTPVAFATRPEVTLLDRFGNVANFTVAPGAANQGVRITLVSTPAGELTGTGAYITPSQVSGVRVTAGLMELTSATALTLLYNTEDTDVTSANITLTFTFSTDITNATTTAATALTVQQTLTATE